MRYWRLNVKGLREIHHIQPGMMSIILVRTTINALFPFVSIYMSSVILNAIIAQEPAQTLLFYAMSTVIINAFGKLLIGAFDAVVGLFQSKFSTLYDWNFAHKTSDLDFSYLENPSILEKKQRIQDIRNLNAGGIWKFIEVFPAIVSGVITLVVSISLSIQLIISTAQIEGNPILRFACSPVSSILLTILIFLGVVAQMYSNSKITSKMYSIMDGFVSFNRVFSYYLEHYISSYHAGKDIRLYNQKGLIDEEANVLFENARHTFDRLTKNQIKYTGISTISSIVILSAVYLFVGLRALAGMFPVGNILVYINSINQFVNGLNSVMANVGALRTNQDALKEYFDYMEIESAQQEGHLSLKEDVYTSPEITFCNVSFRYPGTEQDILKNISFTISAGIKTALVGLNGSGKTTLIKLLCRMYDPNEGKILLNGVDIREYNYEEYVKLFGVAFQDYKVLSFSLGQNVAVSMSYDNQKVSNCLRKAGFIERFSTMEAGLNTPLYKDFEEGGVEISGGEAQKIAIARALYKGATFVIFDEPTAALDPIAEAEIYGKMNDIVEDKTAIFISHRLSSCRFCDSILVFSDGQLMQQGTHAELLEDTDGLYHSMWNAQAQYYTDR